jgi:hypothetical protein
MPPTPFIDTDATDVANETRLRRSLFSRLLSLSQSETVFFLVLVAVLAFPGLVYLHNFYVNDPDLGWHLRSGQWILQNHSFPRTDPFSIYGADKPWIAYSWLFSVLLYKLHQWMGLSGIAVFEVVIRTALAFALYDMARRLGSGFWRAAALTVLALYPMFRIIGPRPGMFTILFLIFEFSILAASRSARSALWLLPPLFALWANLHIQFVYGLFVLGVFAGEPLLNSLLRYRSEHRFALRGKLPWLVLAASFLATLLNPYAWRVYQTVFQYIGQTKAFNSIIELQAMDFRYPANFALLFLGLAAAYALGWRRNFRPVQVFLLLFSAALAFRAVKDVWFLSIVCLWILAENPAGETVRPALNSLRHKIAVPVCVLAVLLFAARRYGLTNDMLQMSYDGRFPEAAARYIEQHRLPGPLFNDFNWGGFLIWRLPQYRVSIDGRTNVHGDDRVGRYGDTWRGKPGWDSDPDLAQANLVLAPKAYALFELLRKDSRFRLVFEDSQAAVFVRR